MPKRRRTVTASTSGTAQTTTPVQIPDAENVVSSLESPTAQAPAVPLISIDSTESPVSKPAAKKATGDPMARLIAQAQALAAKPKALPKAKTPKDCLCGCGGQTKGGDFISGHNGRLLKLLIEQERAKLEQAKVEQAS